MLNQILLYSLRNTVQNTRILPIVRAYRQCLRSSRNIDVFPVSAGSRHLTWGVGETYFHAGRRENHVIYPRGSQPVTIICKPSPAPSSSPVHALLALLCFPSAARRDLSRSCADSLPSDDVLLMAVSHNHLGSSSIRLNRVLARVLPVSRNCVPP
jgi:hypothetical protein